MEKMASKISLVLFISIVLVVSAATALKVMDDHKEKLLLVARRKIEEAATKCHLENKCTSEETTLATLIDLKYLDQQIHPISKEYINGDLKVYCKDYICSVTLQ